MSSYLSRNLEETIKYLMAKFPCIVLLGARQVGKSTLLKKVLPGFNFYDLERREIFERVHNDPELFLDENSTPLVIDEAQLCPELFPALRVKIDEDRHSYGRYLISGSSSPHLLKNISESLAGRVAIIEVPTLSWNEALKRDQSKIYDQLEDLKDIKALKANYKRDELYDLLLSGLYPEAFLRRKDTKAYDIWLANYFQTYIERDIRALFPTLKLESYQRFIKMLAFSSGELINASSFARSLDISQPSIKHYMEIAEGTFLWRKLNCYNSNTKKRLVKMPKGHLRDSSIVNHLLNLHSVDDLKSHPQFGRIWESFIIEQIIKNLDSKLLSHQEFFYRTHNQTEIDLIIQVKHGLIPVEIKSGKSTKKDQLRSINNFIQEHQCKYGLVINNGDEICKLSDKVYQVPAVYL